QAQQTLQASGFSQGALRAEPRAAAEGYARLRAEADAAELRLRALRTNLTGNAPEVQQQLELLAGLRDRISRAEKTSQDGGSSTYLTVYREFKYHEMLFELFSRQYELARVDEAREGAMVQVVDAAQPPERRARPKRAQIVLTTTAAAAVFIILVVLVRQAWRRALYLRVPPASPRSSASS
ncbi:MAG: GNVR domain-containing protein, partial [Rubrivivax sp.]|nr:GNVR domain-containing protein [Rubrivivax sp.]